MPLRNFTNFLTYISLCVSDFLFFSRWIIYSLLDTVDYLIFVNVVADGSVDWCRSMGCSLWRGEHPGLRLGFHLLPRGRHSCSSQAAETRKLIQLRRLPRIRLISCLTIHSYIKEFSTSDAAFHSDLFFFLLFFAHNLLFEVRSEVHSHTDHSIL